MPPRGPFYSARQSYSFDTIRVISWLVFVVLGLVSFNTAQAATASWNVNANGNWTADANWTAVDPQATTDIATFGNATLTANRTVTLDANRSIGSLVFKNNNFGYTIVGSNNNRTLTLNFSAGLTQNGSAANTIATPLILNTDQTWGGTGTGQINITGAISGSAALTKTGSYTLALSAANTYTGTTTINGGTAAISDLGSLSTGPVAIANNAELQLNYSNGTNAAFGNVTIYDGTIRATNAAGQKTGFLGGTNILTVAGNANLIDQGNDPGGYLSMDGAVNVQTGATLTANAASTFDTIRFGLNQNITLAAGATLATTGNGTVQLGNNAARTIVGQGTASKESILRLGAATTAANNGTKFQVDGSGTGGLRIEGTQAKVDALVTDARLAATTGSGGTLTIAYTAGGNRTLTNAANLASASSLKLGLVSNGGTFTLGTAGNAPGALNNWGGLVVGANTTVSFAQSNVFNSTASLDMLGGTLALNGTTQAFGALNVSSNSIIDFGGTASLLNVNSISIATGAILTIANWTNSIDFFYSQLNPGTTNLSQIVFTSYPSNAAHWQSWDKQVTPVPEPSTYGLLFMGAGLAFYLWRRRHS